MELISVASKKVEGAYVNGNVLTIRFEDGSILRAEATVKDGKPILDIIR